jgi:hypothetical protein
VDIDRLMGAMLQLAAERPISSPEPRA